MIVKNVTASVFIFVAGYPHFLHHPVQTSTLWELCLPSLGSGGRLGHCHGLHHLDSFGCHPHIVGVAWLFNAGNVHLLFACLFMCMWCRVMFIHCKIQLCVNSIGEILQQKLKLSLTPSALDEMSKMPYYEGGGKEGYPGISVISSNIRLTEKPIQMNFWYLWAQPWCSPGVLLVEYFF